tara:strand:+ start:585 stop:800 length:216 start_codon:yes stop_codon:yes gene_type:complete
MTNFNPITKRLMFDKKEYSKVYYQENKEKIKEYSKKYYYDVARKLKNITPRPPKPLFKKIYFKDPITVSFD